ncbi:hypothetical protein GCM10025882_20820 [Acinetobacter gyllenbergii]|uniref:Uncharacterized protein n=1 Tax=Acinetobacter gyllenbergii CIP 110306 = MTCC 11365 TaxID=1217657 RepID=A0A829HJ41_9GAMM|nr:hypothetical protein [Acinetobacter gyllenbergii]EPF87709.1 hypothetical protein F957_01577 [Acinetobacter gyllenbergii CIP 110306 = MTCC 11365]GMA11657.1 hypothetical protein GCM10025882_20820 [Acinetobacter gyllenbergii]
MNKLKNVVYVLAEKITNRYHDYNGFWGIGVLYSDCLQYNTTRIELDLLHQTSSLESKNSIHFLNDLIKILMFYLDKNNLNLEQLKAVKIIIEYDLDHNISQRNVLWGDFYSVEVKIMSICDRMYKQERYGYCFPHLMWDREKCGLSDTISPSTVHFLKNYFYKNK